MKDQAALREKTAAFVKAFNAKDVPQVLDVYTENSVFMPPNQPVIRGKDALKTFYDDLLKQGASNLKLDVGEVSGHGPLAYQAGTYQMDLKPSAGPATTWPSARGHRMITRSRLPVAKAHGFW